MGNVGPSQSDHEGFPIELDFMEDWRRRRAPKCLKDE